MRTQRPLTSSMRSIYAYFRFGQIASISDIAKYTGTSISTTHRLVCLMVDDGLVKILPQKIKTAARGAEARQYMALPALLELDIQTYAVPKKPPGRKAGTSFEKAVKPEISPETAIKARTALESVWS